MKINKSHLKKIILEELYKSRIPLFEQTITGGTREADSEPLRFGEFEDEKMSLPVYGDLEPTMISYEPGPMSSEPPIGTLISGDPMYGDEPPPPPESEEIVFPDDEIKGRVHSHIRRLNKNPEWNQHIEDAAADYGVGADFLRSIISTETGYRFDPDADPRVSYTGAAGLVQFQPSTGRAYGLKVPGTGKFASHQVCHGEVDGLKCINPTTGRVKNWTMTQRDPEIDERLDPSKAIPAAARFLSNLQNRIADPANPWSDVITPQDTQVLASEGYFRGYGGLRRHLKARFSRTPNINRETGEALTDRQRWRMVLDHIQAPRKEDDLSHPRRGTGRRMFRYGAKMKRYQDKVWGDQNRLGNYSFAMAQKRHQETGDPAYVQTLSPEEREARREASYHGMTVDPNLQPVGRTPEGEPIYSPGQSLPGNLEIDPNSPIWRRMRHHPKRGWEEI